MSDYFFSIESHLAMWVLRRPHTVETYEAAEQLLTALQDENNQ